MHAVYRNNNKQISRFRACILIVLFILSLSKQEYFPGQTHHFPLGDFVCAKRLFPLSAFTFCGFAQTLPTGKPAWLKLQGQGENTEAETEQIEGVQELMKRRALKMTRIFFVC